MNILLINHYAGSLNMGMEYRPYYLAKNWVKRGNNVTILTATYSHLRNKNPLADSDFAEEIIDGINYCYIKTPAYDQNDIKRFINIQHFVNKLKFNAKKISEKYTPDIVIASSTYPFDIIPANKIAEISNAKLIFELHDLWPLSLIELYGYSQYNPFIMYIQHYTNAAFSLADKVVSILPDADRYMLENDFDTAKFVHIPNGIEITAERNGKIPAKQIDFINRFKAKNMFIVMYLGGFAAANAVDDFVAAAKYTDNDIIFIAIGNGSNKINLKRYVRLNNISNIFFLDAVEKNQTIELLKMADCLYIGAKKINLYKYGIGMNKLFEYMLSARPIISAIDASNDYVSNAECGITIEPQNPQKIAETINLLKLKSKEELVKMGLNGRNYVIQNHNYEKLADNFLSVMGELKGGR